MVKTSVNIINSSRAAQNNGSLLKIYVAKKLQTETVYHPTRNIWSYYSSTLSLMTVSVRYYKVAYTGQFTFKHTAM